MIQLREQDWALAESLSQRMPLLMEGVAEVGGIAPRNPSVGLLQATGWASFPLHAALLGGAPPSLLPLLLSGLQLPRALLTAAIALLSGDGATAVAAYSSLGGAEYTTAVVEAGIARGRALTAAMLLATQSRRAYDPAGLVAACAQACEAVPESAVLKGALAEAVQSQLQLAANLPPAAPSAPADLPRDPATARRRSPGTAALDELKHAPDPYHPDSDPTASESAGNTSASFLLNDAEAWLQSAEGLLPLPADTDLAAAIQHDPAQQPSCEEEETDLSAGTTVGERIEIYSKSAAEWVEAEVQEQLPAGQWRVSCKSSSQSAVAVALSVMSQSSLRECVWLQTSPTANRWKRPFQRTGCARRRSSAGTQEEERAALGG